MRAALLVMLLAIPGWRSPGLKSPSRKSQVGTCGPATWDLRLSARILVVRAGSEGPPRPERRPSVVRDRRGPRRDPRASRVPARPGAHVDYYNRPAARPSGTSSAKTATSSRADSTCRASEAVTVTTPTGTRHEAQRFGFDETRDIALLKIEAKGLPVHPKAKLEDRAGAISSPSSAGAPTSEVPTINQGILSALGRMKGRPSRPTQSSTTGTSAAPWSRSRESSSASAPTSAPPALGPVERRGLRDQDRRDRTSPRGSQKSKGGERRRSAWLASSSTRTARTACASTRSSPTPPRRRRPRGGGCRRRVRRQAGQDGGGLLKVVGERKPGDTVELKVPPEGRPQDDEGEAGAGANDKGSLDERMRPSSWRLFSPLQRPTRRTWRRSGAAEAGAGPLRQGPACVRLHTGGGSGVNIDPEAGS